MSDLNVKKELNEVIDVLFEGIEISDEVRENSIESLYHSIINAEPDHPVSMEEAQNNLEELKTNAIELNELRKNNTSE